jgi:hypothetical protein
MMRKEHQGAAIADKLFFALLFLSLLPIYKNKRPSASERRQI